MNTAKKKRERKSRTVFTEDQLKVLESAFKCNKYARRRTRKEISRRAGLDEKQVTVWFQNRRAKDKKKISQCV